MNSSLVLTLTILATACIFLSFKSFKVFKINTLHAIVINYLVCAITGLVYLTPQLPKLQTSALWQEWLPFGMMMGVVFIFTFNIMSRTAQEVSVAASSMASKLALIMPVIVSFLFIQRSAKAYDIINYTGIIITIPSLILASWPKKSTDGQKVLSHLKLPLAVFLLSGAIDTTLNLWNAKFESDPGFVFFPIVVFASAGVSGFIYLFWSKKLKTWEVKSFIGGLYLGIPNFFSLFFLLETLKAFNQDGGFIFPIVNLGTILVATFSAMFFFRERLITINKIGLILACFAILFIAYQEILVQFNF